MKGVLALPLTIVIILYETTKTLKY